MTYHFNYLEEKKKWTGNHTSYTFLWPSGAIMHKVDKVTEVYN